MKYVVFVILVLFAILLGALGYRQIARPLDVNEIGDCGTQSQCRDDLTKEQCLSQLSGGGYGNACQPDTDGMYHTTTCAPGYEPGLGQIDCVPKIRDRACEVEFFCPPGSIADWTNPVEACGHFGPTCGDVRRGGTADCCAKCGESPIQIAKCRKPATSATPTPSPSPENPILTCSTLTRAPDTTTVVGDTLVFTCTGASVPVGAVSLTYDYQYKIGSGAWQAMAETTTAPTKGRLTIAACGSYTVQCRVCGTIAGQKVCSPVWAGATQ